MSDTESTQEDHQAASTEKVTAETTQNAESTSEELGEGGKKALTAEREARKQAEQQAKELREKVERFESAQQEAEKAKLSDIERAQAEAKEARDEYAKLQRENDRNKVALEKGVPSDLIEFITGDTAEDMAAKADLLLSRLNTNATAPKPDRTQGHSGPVVSDASPGMGRLRAAYSQ